MLAWVEEDSPGVLSPMAEDSAEKEFKANVPKVAAPRTDLAVLR